MDHNHLLWDDTVAGPKPECNIPGKNIMFQHLNNYNNNYGGSGFSTSSPSILSRSAPPHPLTVLTVLDPVVDVVVPVITRSITILKPNSSSNYYSSGSGNGSTGGHDSSSSVPSSPVDSSSSLSSSPFSPRTPQFDSKGLLLTRRKNPNPNPMTTTTTTKKKLVHEPRTPTVYDWVVISALDR